MKNPEPTLSETSRPADRYHLPDAVMHLFSAFVVAATIAVFVLASGAAPSFEQTAAPEPPGATMLADASANQGQTPSK